MQSEQLLDPKRTFLHVDRSCVPWGHWSFQRMNTWALLPRVQQLLGSTEASSAARTMCRGGLFPKPDPIRPSPPCEGEVTIRMPALGQKRIQLWWISIILPWWRLPGWPCNRLSANMLPAEPRGLGFPAFPFAFAMFLLLLEDETQMGARSLRGLW